MIKREMKATQCPWYNKQRFKEEKWKVTLASHQKGFPTTILIPNSKGLMNMELELLWDCLNKKSSNFEIDWSSII